MVRRAVWWAAATAAIVAAAVVALTWTPGVRPRHFWVITGTDPAQPYDAPDGTAIGGWSVGERGRVRYRNPGSPAFDVQQVQIRPTSTPLLKRLHTWFAVPVPKMPGHDAIVLEAPTGGWAVPGVWVECVDAPQRLPPETVPDPALEGGWEVVRSDGSSGPRWWLLPDGELVYEEIERRPTRWGPARWGRIGDVLYLDTGPDSASHREDGRIDGVCEVVVLSADLQTWRGRDGMRGRRRP